MKNIANLTVVIILGLSIMGCSNQKTSEYSSSASSKSMNSYNTSTDASRIWPPPNAAATGFDVQGSDAMAIIIADKVMENLGGRLAWDQTRYIKWTHYTGRTHIWDKYTGDYRIDWTDDDGSHWVVISNTKTGNGKAWQDGIELNNKLAIESLLDQAYNTWLNDSYCMFMPYKLKEAGTTLKYLGEKITANNRFADVLEVTFINNSYFPMPQCKYEVYVDKETGLVSYWGFYENLNDTEPTYDNPWDNWKRYQRILLSSDRGQGRKLTDISVLFTVPDSTFNSPNPVNIGEVSG